MIPTRPAQDREPAAPRRALWRGTLAFGLVSIPVSLRRAVTRRRVHFHELHDADGGRIRRRAVCSLDGAAVTREHIVRGFEVERGRWVTVSADELQALGPPESRTIEIVAFVDPREIDPVLYEKTYWLVPEEGGEQAHALLVAAMERTHRAALARFTMRARRHLAAIRPAAHEEGGPPVLALSTLVYAEEILPAGDVVGLVEVPGAGERDLALAERLVDALSSSFRPAQYHDEQREQILAYLTAKAARVAPVPPPEPAAEQEPPIDLRGALEASLAEAEQHRTAA